MTPQATFSTQPEVEVRDAGGNLVTSATNAVTLAIKSGTGTSGASLLGTTTVSAVNGVATFTDVRIDRPGSGFVLTATASALISVDSAAFTVTQGPPAALAVLTSPSGATGGVSFATQPVVRLLDGDGNLVTGATNNVTVAIKSGQEPPARRSPARPRSPQ